MSPGGESDPGLEAVVRRYVQAWNTPDDEARAALLASCFAEDGVYVDPAVQLAGRAALLDHSRRFAEHWPAATIVLTSGVDVHHGRACFTWQVRDGAGRPVRDGLDVVETGADGLLRRVVGFFGRYRSPAPL